MTEFSTIHCGHFPICSGCQLQKDILRPPILRQIREYFAQYETAFPLFFDAITGFRTRAKLAVRGTAAAPQIGLFKRGTHDVEEILDCPLHHSAINAAIEIIRQAMIEEKIMPYDETTLSGDLRYLQFVVERKTNKVQLTLVCNDTSVSSSIKKLVDAISKKPLWHSIWINFQKGSTNRILGDEWLLQNTTEDKNGFVWETLAGGAVCFHPACFSQAHLPLFEKMLLSIQKMVPPNKNIVEFYGGVGVIGLTLAKECDSLVCSEINPFSQECFEQSKQKLSVDEERKVSFIVKDAKECLFLLDNADVVIVDPPRKGLDPLVLKALIASSVQDLIYVSCGFASFQKEADQLLASGWSLKKAEGYLLFPGSDHIEILAHFHKM